ncbi:Uncharacterised protein [Segatella copri]|nr:Uncharacterised protein [Segatella copri]
MITQSGCFSKSSLLGFTISGSIQIPNFTPAFLASLTNPGMPSGSLLLVASQSPRPAWSSLRGYLLANQPSSSKNISTPRSLASFINSARLCWLKSKPVFSQLFKSVRRSSIPMFT